MRRTMLYFAYGSNMLSTRLRARCPSAHHIGLATATGWTVSFTKPGGDGSGKAGLVEAADALHLGIVYEIAAAEVSRLDVIEGVGHGYRRLDDFDVRLGADSTHHQVTTYVPTRHDPQLQPFDWYLALCIAGAHENAFPKATIDAFTRTSFTEDPQPGRSGRLEAVDALQAAGHHNWRALLG